MASRSRGRLLTERWVQPLPALEEPYAFALSVIRERSRLAAYNGFPLDGGVCAVQSGIILPGAARHFHWMGTHQLSCAVIMLQATRDVRKVALWLGNSDMRTTEVYLCVDPSEKLEAMEAVLPPSLCRGRFKAPDALIAFLQRSQ